VYPKIYAEVREEMLVHLASLRVPPPYQQRVQLAILMGIPSDPPLTPEFIAAMQATKAPASSPAQAGGVPGSSPGRRGRPIDTDPMMAPSERIEAGRR
jgi:hypothetical protein